MLRRDSSLDIPNVLNWHQDSELQDHLLQRCKDLQNLATWASSLLGSQLQYSRQAVFQFLWFLPSVLLQIHFLIQNILKLLLLLYSSKPFYLWNSQLQETPAQPWFQLLLASFPLSCSPPSLLLPASVTLAPCQFICWKIWCFSFALSSRPHLLHHLLGPLKDQIYFQELKCCSLFMQLFDLGLMQIQFHLLDEACLHSNTPH